MDGLSSSDRASIKQVQQFTGCSHGQGLRALAQTKWNVEAAADLVLEEGVEVDMSEDDEVQVVPGKQQDYTKVDKWFDQFKDDTDSIEVNGIMKFSDALGIDPETDPVILVLAEVMSAKEMLHFSREEFRQGMKTLRVDSTESLKKVLPSLRSSINDKRKFKNLYSFLYGYALDVGQKVMTKEMALGLWKLLFPDRFGLFPKWVEYFEKNHKHGVSKDLWSQFLVFSELPGINEGDYTAFDKVESWPLVLDEFVLQLRGK